MKLSYTPQTLALIEVFKVPTTSSEQEAEGRDSEVLPQSVDSQTGSRLVCSDRSTPITAQIPHLDGRDAIHLATASISELTTFTPTMMMIWSAATARYPDWLICNPQMLPGLDSTDGIKLILDVKG